MALSSAVGKFQPPASQAITELQIQPVESKFQVLYDSQEGRYYFVNKETGVSQWEPPPEYEEVYQHQPEVKKLQGSAPSLHSAAVAIQGLLTLRNKARKPPLKYEKYLDTATGRFYYVNTLTKETTWDTPAGSYPLAKPSKEVVAGKELEKAMILSKKKLESEERKRLIMIRREEHRRKERDKLSMGEKKAQEHSIELWNEAFRKAVTSGELDISWQKLGKCHEDLPRFEQMFGKPLQGLKLVGHELNSLPHDFGDSGLRGLISLSLASNNLENLPESICKLTRLRSLNLLRNKLTCLPTKFGNLVNLETLLISSNRIEYLPPNFGNLTRLERVEVNANKLRKLPDSIGRLKCRSLVCNGNLITVLTPHVAKMVNLKWLCLNDNNLEYLPREIGDCPVLERLHIQGNKLIELPDSIGKLEPLRELWLSQNPLLTSLPQNFYCLSNLRSLNMAMCPSMVFPPQKYIEKGVAEVLAYSESRLSHVKHLKRFHIVETMMNCCLQLYEQAPYFGREAKKFFIGDVEHEKQEWYALALPTNNFIAFKVNVKKLYRLLESEKKRKVPTGRLAKEIYDEEMEKAAKNPGGMRDFAANRMCDEIFGFRPLLVSGGDKGVELMARFQAQADFEEGIADELESKSKGLIRPGAGAQDPEEAKAQASRSAAQKASVKRAAEREALKALGPPEETLTIGEVVAGSECEKAGTQGGMKILSVGGKVVSSYRQAIQLFIEAAMLHAPGAVAPPVEPNPNADLEPIDDKPWKPPKEIEVRIEMSGGKFSLFWQNLLPALEGYWAAGRENPDDFFIPRKYIQTFGYDREEVSRVMNTFRDPSGLICKEKKSVMFHRCGCVDSNGKRRVCVPPSNGYMCTRDALLIKKELVRQREKDKKDDSTKADAEIQAVEAIARDRAEKWARSEEGKLFLANLVQKATKDSIDDQRRERNRGKLSEELERKISVLDEKHHDEYRVLKDKLLAEEEVVNKKKAESVAQLEGLSGLALELVEQDIQAFEDELIALTEKYNLHKLNELHEEAVNALIEEDKVKNGRDEDEAAIMMADNDSKKSKKSNASTGSGFDVFGTGYKKVHDSLEVDVYNQFIEREVRKAREEKQRQLANLDKIKKAWGGVSLGECFFAWRKYARLNVNTKVRDAARIKRNKFEARQVPKAAIKLARYKVLVWGKPSIDIWSDEKFWTNQKTGEIRWTAPSTKEYLPKNFEMPKEYRGYTDQQLDAIHIRDDVPYEDVEVPYQREELGDDASSQSSYSSDSSSDSDSSEDSDSDDDDSDEEGDASDDGSSSAMSSTASSTASSTTSSAMNTADSFSMQSMTATVDPSLLLTTEMEDTLGVPKPKKPIPLAIAKSRSEDEAGKALIRMRERRDRAVDKARAYREFQLAKAERQKLLEEELAAQEADGEVTRVTGVIVGNMTDDGGASSTTKSRVGRPPKHLVGGNLFDPSRKDYTEAELTQMAMEEYKRNAKKGGKVEDLFAYGESGKKL